MIVGTMIRIRGRGRIFGEAPERTVDSGSINIDNHIYIVILCNDAWS